MMVAHGRPGSRSRTLAPACSRTTIHAPLTAKELAARRTAGIITSCGGQANRERWVSEAREYLASHPGATVFDLALECHLGDKQAKNFMREIMGDQPKFKPWRLPKGCQIPANEEFRASEIGLPNQMAKRLADDGFIKSTGRERANHGGLRHIWIATDRLRAVL